MNNSLKHKVAFDQIRYANCWEDADILLEGLNARAGSKILSIGSAGDNCFSLLSTTPELVVAVDINPIQLHLIALKQAAIANLNYEAVLGFLGFKPSQERVSTYEQLKHLLPIAARNYWDTHRNKIQEGIIFQGKFESYFKIFAGKILPWIHTRQTTELLLAEKSEAAQKEFYHQKWNTFSWKLLFRVFFSRYVMGKYGRDPEFLKQVEGSVGNYIYNKAATHLQSSNCQHNFILRFNLTGSFGHLLPHYLMPENFELIKSNISKLVLIEGYAESAMASYGKFDYMNLSNIFEYMNQKTFGETATLLKEALHPGGRMAYWNLMVPRSVASLFPNELQYLESLSERLTTIDKGFFYNEFIVDQKV